MPRTVVAEAHPNIALVKYWGKRDRDRNLPTTGSLSLTLGPFRTRTAVTWGARRDRVAIDGRRASGRDRARVLRFLDLLDPARPPVEVVSESDFPVAAGLASSASAYAALATAAAAAAGLPADPVARSVLARQGSGSACRSIFGGWVHWRRGTLPDGSDSHGVPLAPPDHWELRVVAAIVHGAPKAVGSTEGMLRTQATSPFYAPWADRNQRDLGAACEAVIRRDFEALAPIVERSALGMHATMLGADPPLRYLEPASVACWQRVEALRAEGLSCCWTMDAGPHVKVLCPADQAEAVAEALRPLVERVAVLAPAGPARCVEGA